MVAVVEEMDSEEILAAVESVYREQVEGNAFCFRAAYEFARIHNGDAVDAAGRVLPGTERAVRIGGPGTPSVREFAAVQFGARMQMGTLAARYYLADALDVWHRLPRIAARLEAGEVKVALARHVAKATRHLSVQAAAQVDAEMAEVADGRLPWTRFCERLEGRIVDADPELAAQREAEARAQAFARPTRGSEHGMKGFYIRGPVAWITRIDASVAYLAEALKTLGDTDNLDLRRLKACVIAFNPTDAVELLAAFAAHRAHVTDQPLPLHDPDDEQYDDPSHEPADPDQPADPEEPYDDPSTDEPSSDDAGGDEVVQDQADAQSHGSADQAADAETDGGEAPEATAEPADGEAKAPEQPQRSGWVVPFARPLPFRPTDLPGWLARLARSCAEGTAPDDPRAGDPGWSVSWQRLLPQTTLFVHVAAETVEAGQGVVRWEGEGPTTWDYLRDLVLPHQPLRVTPVIDLAGQEPVDAYEIPERHRQAVHLRTPADCFPYATSTSREVDTDHTEEYQHTLDDQPDNQGGEQAGQRRVKKRGQSRVGNYGPLARFHHRIKTHGHWTVKQPFDGIYVWRDPSGEFYLVDHTGTRKITDGTLPTRRALPEHDGIHFHQAPFAIDLDPDFACAG